MIDIKLTLKGEIKRGEREKKDIGPKVEWKQKMKINEKVYQVS